MLIAPTPDQIPDPDLDTMVADIVEQVTFPSTDIESRLRSPHLRIERTSSAADLDARTEILFGHQTILMGGGLYPFLCQYLRAASSYFLTCNQGGTPAPNWHAGRSSLATTLDWLSTPTEMPHRPAFTISRTHDKSALSLALYTYRFLLCHELAHVALGHSPIEAGSVPDNITPLHQQQDQELKTDRMALTLQVRSIPTRSETVKGLAGAVYAFAAEALRNSRLMLLAELVDERQWEIELTHPPTIQREFGLLGAANGLCGQAAMTDMHRLRNDLRELNDQVLTDALHQQQMVVKQARQLLRIEMDTLRLRGNDPLPAVLPDLLGLFSQSPVGVMKALEHPPNIASDDTSAIASLIDRLVAELPAEFQDFHNQSPRERAIDLA